MEFLKQLSVNSSDIRYEEQDGIKFAVVQMTMMAEGSMTGSDGELYYPGAEIERSVDDWNDIPIVVNHPKKDGQYVTVSSDPAIFNSTGVGRVKNPKYEAGKLKAEAWLDLDKCNDVDERIVSNLDSRIKTDVSTGLLLDSEEIPGTSVSVTKNYQPDHLAVLLDERGACPTPTCGLLVNKDHSEKEDMVKQYVVHSEVREWLVTNEMTHDEIHESLQSQLPKDSWISEIADSYVIYTSYVADDRVYFKQNYSRTGDKVELSNEQPVKVEKKTSFVPVVNETQIEKENEMSKKDALEKLTANCSCEKDKAVLNQLSEEGINQLLKVTANSEEETSEEEAETTEETETETETKEEGVQVQNSNTPPKRLTEEEFFALAPASVQTAVANAMRIEQDAKETLISEIIVNSGIDPTSEDGSAKRKFLEAKPLNELEVIKSMIPEAKTQSTMASYFGRQGMPTANTAAVEEEPLAPPTMDWEELAKN